MPIFKAVKANHPDFTSEKFTKENIFEQLFPGKKFDQRADSHIRTLVSELFRLCKEFLTYTSFRKDESRKNYYLLGQLRTRKIYNEFDKLYPPVEFPKYEDDFVHMLMEKYFILAEKLHCELDRNRFENLFEAMIRTKEYSIVMAMINSLRFEDEKNTAQAYKINLRRTYIDTFVENTDMDKLLKDMKDSNESFYPYVQTFYLVYKMTKYRDNVENYFALKKHFESNLEIFSRADQYMILGVLRTYCSIQTEWNYNRDFVLELYNLQKFSLEKNIYKRSDSEDFNVVLFRNIVMKALGFKEDSWLEEFIKKYSSELHPEHRENIINFSLAHLYFLRKDFGKSLEYVQRIKFDLFLYKGDIRILQFKLYYELGYIEQVFSHIDSSLHYLNNTKEMSKSANLLTVNFFKYAKELVRLSEKRNIEKQKVEYLKDLIVKEKNAYGMEWLCEKCDELISNE